MNDGKKKILRGFATMSPERRKELASLGGKSVKRENRTFVKNKKAASKGGKKGGKRVKKEDRIFSKDREHAAAMGRKGGAAAAKKRWGLKKDEEK